MVSVTDNEVVAKLKQAKDTSEHPGFDYAWYYKSRLPERRFTRCRVLAVGSRNTALVEFLEDGAVVVSSRYAIRKISKLNQRDKRKVLYGGEKIENLALDFQQDEIE